MTVKKDQKVAGVTAVKASGASITGAYAVGQTLTAKYPDGTVGTIQFTRTMASSPFTKSLINGAVASAVNSLNYTLQSADAGCNIGVDCSNQVASTPGGLVPSAAVASVQQAVKMRPNDGYNILTGTSNQSALRTSYYKWEIDADWNSVQVVISSKVSSGAQGNFKAQFAVTDDISNATISRAFVPQRAGVAYNDLSANGWKDVTFGGAATALLGLAPFISGSNNSSISMTSDPLALPSVARADGKAGGILLLKVVQIDALGQFTQEGGSNTAYDLARGNQAWFREAFVSSRAGVDGIATLTSLPTAVTEASTGYAISAMPIVTTTTNIKPTELVLFTGDSRKAAAFSTYSFNNPNRQALMSISTAAHPISAVDGAGSGHSQTQYLQIALDLLTAGLRPTVIYLPGFSQNGFTTYTAFKTANDNFMASARAISGLSNVKFVLDTDYFVSGYAGGAAETYRQQCIAYAKSLANGSTVFCFDSDIIMTDYTTPATPVLKSAYMNADGVHANQAGQDAMTYGDGKNPGLQALYKTVFGIT